nr:U4 [Milk vetch dwarf virus]UVC58084.1 U4 [Milk vetch dwarf virus]
MEARFLLLLAFVVVILQPSLVLHMVLGYMLGVVIKKNYSRLKVVFLGEKKEQEEEEDDALVEDKNPFADVETDVMKHLKTLGLDLKDLNVPGEDIDYLQRFWEAMSSNKNK